MAATSNTHLLLKTHFNPLHQSHLTQTHNPNLNVIRKTTTIRCSVSAPAATTTKTTSDRVFNFAAGPAVLPEKVLLKAQSEMLNWGGSGMSVMEMSHRGKEFTSIIEKAESDLRSLLNIPSEYAVLFLQGGATSQFSALPLNLCVSPKDPVDYLVTGSWGDKAAKEAAKYSSVTTIWSGKSDNYVRIPDFSELKQNPEAKYLHICANETIYGVEFKDYPVPANKDGILVADMSSNFCSKPVDVSKFGVIYAGAQKNVGPSGVTIVIVRKDLIGNAQGNTPIMFDYKIHAENKSLYNTPPCYGIYMCGLVFEDLLQQGGLSQVEKNNIAKAQLLYDAIDNSQGFFRCPVEKSVRSLMNVPFTLANAELEPEFIKLAAKEKMVALKGHRSVGGMRASIYNAMPLAGVQKLVAFMKDFQSHHG
ncbi:phosphoserine aminotransferase, chloroplastic-like [Silene latifolia]|uniref:phosphoserine aminotransferase, chloroplastic-like n=1 Tax=Silene latifolia TaxID=37657 RepID=UPI003D76FE46